MYFMYTKAARDRMLHPERVGPLNDATNCGRYGSTDGGPTITIWLQVENGRVSRAAWSSNGCVAMIACASAVAELSEGKDASYLVHLSPEEVLELIGPLPQGKEHVPELALTALRKALESEAESP